MWLPRTFTAKNKMSVVEKNLIKMKKVIRVVCPVFVPFGTEIN